MGCVIFITNGECGCAMCSVASVCMSVSLCLCAYPVRSCSYIKVIGSRSKQHEHKQVIAILFRLVLVFDVMR